MANFYADQLRRLQENPNGFTGSPGAQWGMDQGLESVNRRMVGGRGSGGAMAALVKYGVGAGSQDYGNEFQRRFQAAGLEQSGNQADARLALDTTRTANDYSLGQGNLDLGRTRAANDLTLGQGAQATTQRGQSLDFLRGTTRDANDFTLGQGQNANTGQRNWWDYSLGQNKLNSDNANAANTNNLNWFRAQTERGGAQATDWKNRDEAARAWMPYAPVGNGRNLQWEDRRPAWSRGY